MRFLGMHKLSHQQWLNQMIQSKYVAHDVDKYNDGPLVTALESRIKDLLGKPAALFFNKGTTCQLAALKVHTQIKKNHKVMLHPQSHIAIDEQDAYQALMGLSGVLVGKSNVPISFEDVKASNEQVAVLVIELPLRRAGFKLPEWNELLKLRQWCDDNQVIMHLDGARIWESATYYHKTWAEIAALFDSVYVSLYKGVGAISGAVLLGETEFINQCHVWRNRLGSNMWTTFPTLITALEGLDNNLPQIATWVNRAEKLALALQTVDGLIVETPHTNGFQIKLIGDVDEVNSRLNDIIEHMQLTPCGPFASIVDSEFLYAEIQVGANHQSISDEKIVQFFQQLTLNIES